MATIQELLDKKKGFVDAATEIRDRVYAEQAGEWRGDDTKKFDDLMAQADGVTSEIDRAAKLDAAARSLTTTDQPQQRKAPVVAPTARETRVAQPLASHAEAMAIQAWMLGGTNQRTAAHAEAAAKLGLTLDQKQITLRMGARPPRSLRREDLDEWEKRDLTVGVVSPDNGGHYTTQIEMLRALEVASLAYGGIYAVASVDRTESGSDLPYPQSNDTANEGALIGETVQETAEADPVLNQMVLQAFTYSSKKVFMSLEYIQDNAINAVGRIGGMLGERIARIRNRHFTVGTGSGQPNGIVTAATSSGITTASGTAISYDELVDLEHSVDPSYRLGARFMFHDNTLKALKKIKVPQFSGDTAGYPLWKAGMTSGDPDTINGYAYVINQHMPLPTSGLKAVVFGALSKYQVREVRDITLMRLDELYAEYRQVVFLAWARFDGDLNDAGTHPVKYLTMG